LVMVRLLMKQSGSIPAANPVRSGPVTDAPLGNRKRTGWCGQTAAKPPATRPVRSRLRRGRGMFQGKFASGRVWARSALVRRRCDSSPCPDASSLPVSVARIERGRCCTWVAYVPRAIQDTKVGNPFRQARSILRRMTSAFADPACLNLAVWSERTPSKKKARTRDAWAMKSLGEDA